MKSYYASSLIVFASMVAVLHAGASLAERVAPDALTRSVTGATAATIATTSSGVVEAIKARPASSDRLDAAADNLIGNQVISRDGRTISMLAGAMLGLAPQGHPGARPVYDIQVRMRDGSQQNFVQDSTNGLRVGDRVRPEGGRVYRS